MRRLLSVFAVAALCGCGASAAVHEPDATVTLTLTDFRIAPQSVAVHAGEVTFRVHDAGRLPHNVSLRGPTGERVVVSTMLPGASAQATIRLAPGTYRMFCAIANHEELGQYGTLHVR